MLSLFQHVIVSFSFVTEYFFKSKALKRSELIFVLFFLKGHGVEQNETEAIKLFQMSAEQVQTHF